MQNLFTVFTIPIKDDALDFACGVFEAEGLPSKIIKCENVSHLETIQRITPDIYGNILSHISRHT